MALQPFRTVLDDPFSSDWMVFDPFRETGLGSLLGKGGMKGGDIGTITKPFAPLLTTDIIECENEFKVLTDMPGIDPNELELNVDKEKHKLFMKAERKQAHEVDNDRIFRMERSYGVVQRTIRLPRSADVENTTCKYKDGVLWISVPKLSEVDTQSKRITIDTA